MIELATGLKIGYLSQDLFWQDKKNTLREEMLLVFSEITGKVNRLKEIENDTEHWEESNAINTLARSLKLGKINALFLLVADRAEASKMPVQTPTAVAPPFSAARISLGVSPTWKRAVMVTSGKKEVARAYAIFTCEGAINPTGKSKST